jgi:translocation and assembly module TamB
MLPTKRLKSDVETPADARKAAKAPERHAPRNEDRQPAERRPSRMFWWGSRLLVMLALCGVLALVAPSIISATGLWRSLLAAAAPEIAPQINAGSVSLAWWAPIEIKGLAVIDEQGQPLAEVASIRSNKTLFQLAANSQDLGTFEVTQPHAKVVLRADGSNIEDFLAKLPPSKDDGGPSAPMQVALVITGGTVELDDTIAKRQWLLGDVTAELNWPTANDQAKSGKLAASINALASGVRKLSEGAAAPAESQRDADASRSPGQMSAEFNWQQGADEKTWMGAGQAELKLAGFPTELLDGALGRFVADIRPQGSLTLDAGLTWTENGQSQHVVLRQLAAPQLVIAAPQLLGEDRLVLVITTGQADVLLAGERLDIHKLQVDSNLVHVAGSGSAALGSLATGDADVQVQGQIDLAELARQLPGALRMRQDAQLTSGVVAITLGSSQQPGGRQWQGSLKTDRLEASAGGRPIVFDQPLAIEFALRQTSEGPVIDRLSGRASFLTLDGRGTLADGSLDATADLDRLVAELGRLIDWRDIQLAGTLGAQLRWNRGAGDAWTAQADARVQNFIAAAAGMAPWQERDLQIGADLTGVVAAGSLHEINSGKLTVVSAGDRLEASLAEAVKEVTAQTAWPLTFSLQGNLATWMPRVQPVVSLAGWEFAGAIDVRGAGRFSPTASQLGKTHVELTDLEIAGPSLWIREPQVKLDTAGTWDQSTLTLTLPETVVQSTSFGLRADDLRLVAASPPAMTGIVDFRGDSQRLSSWIGARGAARSWQVTGLATGRLEIADRGASHEATLVADVEQFQFLTPVAAATATGTVAVRPASTTAAPQWQTTWTESKVSLTAQAAYDPAAGAVKLARSNLKTDWADVAATGTISEVTSRCVTDLAGEISYDLALIEQKIKADLFPRGPTDDPKVQRSIDTLVLQGQEKRPFVLRGPLLAGSLPATADPASPNAFTPLVPSELVGEASLGWQGAQYVGLVAGPADFKARLENGTVFIGPLDIPVSEGRLTTAPRILLNDRVPNLVVDRGPLIQNVRITPEMCNQWLKYVAPLLADATEAEGKFSLGLEGAGVPIFTPLLASVDGNLDIHGAQVGPGPLAKQYLQTARQLKVMIDPTAAAGDNYGRWLLLPEHKVAFAVRDGVVSHSGLTMTAQNFVLTTNGHVRIADQAIELNAEIPIQDSWFKKKEQQALLTSLRGQAIPVKVTGTLSQPRLDTQSIQAFGKQYVGTAVQGLLDKGQQKVQGLLEKEAGKVLGGLDGLFGPKPKTPAPKPAPTP